LKAPKVLLTVVILVLAACVNGYCVNVSPSKIELSISSSRTYEGVLEVRNAEQGVLDVKLRTENWFKAVEGIAKETGTNLEWLKLTPASFELKGQEKRDVRYRVNIPESARGELNAMIFIEAKPRAASQGAISINTSIGVPIYVIITGTEILKAKVKKVEVMKNGPLLLNVLIENSGNVHIRPTGTIVIARSPEGATKQSPEIVLPLNEYNYPILPNSSRTLEIRADKALAPGKYTAGVQMEYDHRKYRTQAALEIK
jgi:hypothetical protein